MIVDGGHEASEVLAAVTITYGGMENFLSVQYVFLDVDGIARRFGDGLGGGFRFGCCHLVLEQDLLLAFG